MRDVKEQTFQAVSQGRKELVEKIYLKYYEKLVWYSSKITGNTDESEGIVTEALIQFMDKAPELKEETVKDAMGYVCVTVRNLSLNWADSNRIRQHLSLDNGKEDFPSLLDMLSAPHEDIEEEAVKREKYSRLYSEMNRLTPKQQKCIRLHYINGLSYDEVARIMGLSGEAVRALGSRAVKKLRSLME